MWTRIKSVVSLGNQQSMLPRLCSWCLTPLFLACRLSGTSVGGWVKYFGRRGDYGGTASLYTQDKGMKESSQLLFSCTHFSGLNCIARFVQRSNCVSGGLFICLDGWIWLIGSYGKAWWVSQPKTTLTFRISFSCSNLLVLILCIWNIYNVIAPLHKKCKKIDATMILNHSSRTCSALYVQLDKLSFLS